MSKNWSLDPVSLLAFAYLGVALLCWKTARRVPFEPIFWWLVGGFLLMLALGKLIDIATLLTAAGRCLANENGFYDIRRPLQIGVIGGFVIGVIWGIRMIAAHLETAVVQLWPALLGLGVLLGYGSIRVVGLHHMDSVFALELGGLALPVLIELLGLALIGGSAQRRASRAGRDRRLMRDGRLR